MIDNDTNDKKYDTRTSTKILLKQNNSLKWKNLPETSKILRDIVC